MQNFLKEAYRISKLREKFKENVELDSSTSINPELNADKIYRVLQTYIARLTQILALRNDDYYKGDRFSTFNAEDFKNNLYSKLKEKIKSKTAEDKLVFEGLPKIKDDGGFYEIENFDGEISLFTSDIIAMEVEEIADYLIGKTLRS